MANDAVIKIAVTSTRAPGGRPWDGESRTILLSTDGGLIILPDGSGSLIIDKMTGYEFKTAKTRNAIGAATGFTDSALT